MRSFLPALTVLVGIALMSFKIYEDGEPGAVPLLLIAVGTLWHLAIRLRSNPKPE